MQDKKSWATIDGALIWKFATSGNSTWMNMTTVTSNNFGGNRMTLYKDGSRYERNTEADFRYLSNYEKYQKVV